MKADEDRAENLFLVTGHISCDVVDDCWGDEVSFRVLRMNIFGSVKGKGSSFFDCTFAKRNNSFLKISIADWTQIDSWFISSSDFKGLSFSTEIFNPLFGLSDKDNSGKCHASLS